MDIIFDSLYFLVILPFVSNFLFTFLIFMTFFIGIILSFVINAIKLKHIKQNLQKNLTFSEFALLKDEASFHSLAAPTVVSIIGMGFVGTLAAIYETGKVAPSFSILALAIFLSTFYFVLEGIAVRGLLKAAKLYIDFTALKMPESIESIYLKQNKALYDMMMNKQDEIMKTLEDRLEPLFHLEYLRTDFKDLSDEMKKVSEDFKVVRIVIEQLNETIQKLNIIVKKTEEVAHVFSSERLGEVIGDAMRTEIGGFLEKINGLIVVLNNTHQQVLKFLDADLKDEIFYPLIESMKENQKTFNEMYYSIESTKSVILESNNNILEFKDNVNEVTNKLENILSISLKDFETDMANMVEVVTKLQKLSIEQNNIFENRYKEIYQELNNLTSNFHKNVTDVLNEVLNVSKDFSNEIKVSLKEEAREISQQTSQVALEINHTLENNVNNLIHNLESSLTDVSLNVNENMNKMLLETQNTMSNLSNSIKNDLVEVSENSHKLVQLSLNKMEITFNKIEESTNNMTNNITQELTNFTENYAQKLDEVIQNTNYTLNDLLQRQIGNIDNIVNNMASVFERDIQNREAINNTLYESTKELNHFLDQLKDVTSITSKEYEHQIKLLLENGKVIEDSFLNIVNHLQNVDQDIVSSFETFFMKAKDFLIDVSRNQEDLLRKMETVIRNLDARSAAPRYDDYRRF